jgi:hypothetical protein
MNGDWKLCKINDLSLSEGNDCCYYINSNIVLVSLVKFDCSIVATNQ